MGVLRIPNPHSGNSGLLISGNLGFSELLKFLNSWAFWKSWDFFYKFGNFYSSFIAMEIFFSLDGISDQKANSVLKVIQSLQKNHKFEIENFNFWHKKFFIKNKSSIFRYLFGEILGKNWPRQKRRFEFQRMETYGFFFRLRTFDDYFPWVWRK